MYSTYIKVLNLFVKKESTLFRTDSQQKLETYLNAGAVEISKTSSKSNYGVKRKNNEISKLFYNMSQNKKKNTLRNRISGINFETMQIVNLELKPHENIGLTLVNGYDNSVLIARIIKDQVAYHSGTN